MEPIKKNHNIPDSSGLILLIMNVNYIQKQDIAKNW